MMTRIIKKCDLKRFLLVTIVLVVIYQYMYHIVPLVHVEGPLHTKNHSESDVRIYCFILTAPENFDTRARAVNSTWAKRCDRYTFISEYSNDTKGLPIAPLADLISGNGNLIRKSISALQYIYENFLNDYEWFVKADDDTYLFVDHLKLFLKDKNSSEPITFGQNFKIIVPQGYHSGGAGYVLSREAVKRIDQAIQNPNTTCVKDGGAEDVEIAKCLRTVGVYPGKSVDEHNRERFHSLTFTDHFGGYFPDWLKEYAENTPVAGPNCCSRTTISFHSVSPEEQYLIDKMHYGFHDKT